MTTQRLYYDDSYTTHFTASVVESLTVNEHPAVILDRTCFYATSGGQPFDTGTLNEVEVIDTFPRDEDAAVVHVLAQPIPANEVVGEVNWPRRFDHMQHHTGQHILTQALVQTSNAKTVSFHLSPDSVTIDLDTDNLSEAQVEAAENLANQIIYENHAVIARLREMDDQEGVRIRRLPKHLLTEGLRVIEIEEFDTTACGGTHVAHTGEIGTIKIIKVEKRGSKSRVEFRCGGRALQDYREKNRISNQIATDFNCRIPETVEALARLRDEYKTTLTALKTATTQLINYEAIELLNTAQRHGEIVLVTAAFESRDTAEIKLLASRLVEVPKTVALLGVAGEKALFCFARSEDLSFNMGQLLKDTLARLGGRGGGQPNFAQGGGFMADLPKVQATLEETTQSIR